jgi:hypothetical protein
MESRDKVRFPTSYLLGFFSFGAKYRTEPRALGIVKRVLCH